MGASLYGPRDPFDERAQSGVADQNPRHQQVRLWRQADRDAISSLATSDGPADVCPVVTAVKGLLGPDAPAKGIDDHELFDAPLQGIVIAIDTGIEHGHIDLFTLACLPHLGNLESLQPPGQASLGLQPAQFLIAFLSRLDKLDLLIGHDGHHIRLLGQGLEGSPGDLHSGNG